MGSNGNKNAKIPLELLDDIASRFLLDAPDSELKDPISLCFLTELAYWFYLDEYVEEDESLNNMKFDVFAINLLRHVRINPSCGSLEEMLQNFRDFKSRVPTYGALLLGQDVSNIVHVLLVQGFWHRATWGFPKGKINVDEDPAECAAREVLEETGYDISSKLDKNAFIETTIGEQSIRLYIIEGVPMDTVFNPKTKGEIKEVKWFPIYQLPAHKNDKAFVKSMGSTNMFYMVMPFIKPLRDWVAANAKKNSSKYAKNQQQPFKDSVKRQRNSNSYSSVKSNSKEGHPQTPKTLSMSMSDAFSFQNYQDNPENIINKQSRMNQSYNDAYSSSPTRHDSKSKRNKSRNNRKNSLSVSDDNLDKVSQQTPPRISVMSRGSVSSEAGQSPLANGPKSSSLSPVVVGYVQRVFPEGFRCSAWDNFKLDYKKVNADLANLWKNINF